MHHIHIKDLSGGTELHKAAKYGNLKLVQLLVSTGENINVLDNDGRTAFDLGKKHIDVASYLGHKMSGKFQDEGKYEDALKMYDALLKIQEEKLGYGHCQTTKTRDCRGSLQSFLYLMDRSDTKPPSLKKDMDTQNAAEGRTLLHETAEIGNLNFVKRLVDLGASIKMIDKDGKTAFDLGKKHIDVATYLGHKMIKEFQEEQKYEDSLKIYEKLLKIQEETLGYDHCKSTKTRDCKGSLESLLYLLGRSDTRPISLMKDINQQNAAEGRTPLHEAAKNGNLIFVKRLVDLGASIRIIDNDGKTAFDLGKQHIDVASYLGHKMSEEFKDERKYEDALKLYEELLKTQEETLGNNHSETIKTRYCIGSLQFLCFRGRSDTKPPSLKKGIDTQYTVEGKTPLHEAAKNGNLKVVQHLVGLGVRIDIFDNDGKTAFDLAKNHLEVALFLAQRMSEKFLEEEKFEDALRICKELYEIQKEKLGCNHHEAIETSKYIKLVREHLHMQFARELCEEMEELELYS